MIGVSMGSTFGPPYRHVVMDSSMYFNLARLFINNTPIFYTAINAYNLNTHCDLIMDM